MKDLKYFFTPNIQLNFFFFFCTYNCCAFK